MSAAVTANERTAGSIPWSGASIQASPVVEFKLKHMMVATVTGRFVLVRGHLEADSDGCPLGVGHGLARKHRHARAKCDEHLRSPWFVAVAAHPQITFRSTAICAEHDGTLTIIGDLTIRGVTRSIELISGAHSVNVEPSGASRVAVTGAAERHEFGLTGNTAVKASGALRATTYKRCSDSPWARGQARACPRSTHIR